MTTAVKATAAGVPEWDEVLADIGDRVRAERQARGWSQPYFSTRSGLTLNQIRRLEAGFIGMRNFARACWALEVPMADLLSDDWQLPERRPVLTGHQVEVLRAVADGVPLAVAASRLGMPLDGLTSRLSKIYRLLGVAHVPRGLERRMAAVRAARENGLLNGA